MLGWFILGAMVAGAAVALTLYAFRDDIREHLRKSGLLQKVTSLYIQKILKKGDTKTIKFSALDDDNYTVKNMEYRVSADTEIDDDIYEGALIAI